MSPQPCGGATTTPCSARTARTQANGAKPRQNPEPRLDDNEIRVLALRVTGATHGTARRHLGISLRLRV